MHGRDGDLMPWDGMGAIPQPGQRACFITSTGENGAAQDNREREWLEAPNGDGTAAVFAAKDMFKTLGNHQSKYSTADSSS